MTIRKGAAGYFWIVTSPEVGEVFETGRGGLSVEQIPMGGTDIYYSGVVNARWKLYIDPLWPTNEILVGANYEPGISPDHVAKLVIANFTI